MNSIPKSFARPSARRRAGFTLLEIMLVVMIIALLAGVAIYNMGDMFGEAQETTAKSNITTFGTALLTYRAKAGNYPFHGARFGSSPDSSGRRSATDELETNDERDPFGSLG